MRRSKKSSAFSGELCEALKNETGNDGWECEVVLYPSTERVDVGLKAHGEDCLRVIIEVELRRGNPVVNIIKVWDWTAKRTKTPILFLHVLSTYYDKKPRWIDYAHFIAKQMTDDERTDIQYKPLRLEYSPRRGTYGIGGAGKAHARQLAKEITAYLPVRVSAASNAR